MGREGGEGEQMERMRGIVTFGKRGRADGTDERESHVWEEREERESRWNG
jgi:ABC-type tungstate transport system permease subunit